MTLTGCLASNSVFAPVWLAETARIRKVIAWKLIKIYTYCLRRKSPAWTLVSGDIRFVRIFGRVLSKRDVKGQCGRSRVNGRRPICGYISETVTDRGIFTIEDEFKVVCALSNSAAFDDLQWPLTPVSRSQYSLNANISLTVHPIHSMFGSRVGYSGTAELMVQLSNFKNPRWRCTRTAIARNPCVSWAFLLQITVIITVLIDYVSTKCFAFNVHFSSSI